MLDPKVTILSPCYNVAKYLPLCLDSIVNQTYQNLQIVMIDDGSSDNTWNILSYYAANDKRIEIYNQQNNGVAYTRNRLLEKVKGDYVLFVDSDDWIEPNMIEFLISEAMKSDADLVTCSMVVNDVIVKPDFIIEECEKEDLIKKFLFHKELTGSLCNKLVKTSLLHKITFDNSISYGEDALFCWHFFQRVNRAILTTRQLYHYRMNPESISHQTFGEKKLTGYKVWETITTETSEWWPEYANIANARWATESLYLLIQASISGYSKDNKIIQIKNKVTSALKSIYSLDMISLKELFNAGILCIWFGYMKYYLHLSHIKNTIMKLL